ncbi:MULTISPECIES: hypothetical protein [Halomonadaceae]|jgi:hypothetical protein|uniref:hypothetical protein n=1 Tax=Halomonadaceae TaxID=28256 RepID=UPI0012F2FC2F|nr:MULTISPECIES: hypothetical protein [Halomonas]CAD5268743.1 conserved hypothetical protein [Halomonas sp. I3]CAD5274663.1 conserved hypothetical protein [Halomonas sp. 113]CAD5276272.1 conserved hypothetical protein [Halomonas sp. 59]CAD5277324.1 conserved hypothetical protein [Halomonas sp. 156]VXB97067.1 conserved hypothetical protein [Halomonas titanicae]
MKIGFSSFTLINQRQDKPQFLTPTRVAPQKSESAEDDPFTKRLKKQQEALESLASLPTPKEASQQQATDKVGFLRQRIEMLKAMMAFASPEQLKNMAKELKSIARELAGAAKLLNNQGGGGAGMTAIPSVVATPAVPTTAVQTTAAQPAEAQANGADSAAAQAGGDESAQVTVSSDAQQAEASAETAEDDAKKAAEQEAEKAAGEPEGDESTELGVLPSLPNLIQNEDNRSKSNGPSASEHALRGVLTDAQKALREAVNELKVRLNEEDKEARRELKKAEDIMEKTDRAVAASTSDALYSSLGQLLPTSLGDVAVSTSSINIEV